MTYFLSTPFKHLLPWFYVLTAGVAWAAPLGPAQSQAPLTRLDYHSAFISYQDYADPAIQPWRAANDRVGLDGNWKAHVKDDTVTPAQSDQHEGHEGHHKGAKQ